MAFSIRRIVTGHDADGKAIIVTDNEMEALEGRPGTGIHNAIMWATDQMPVDINGEDRGGQKMEIAPGPNGSIFRILEVPPGAAPYNHRTDTIDYVIVLEGEIDMTLEGSEVHMNTGDVMIQCGTIHAWDNRETKPCRIAFILMDGKM